MASRGWEHVTQTDITRRELKQAAAKTPSKYKNVRVQMDGHAFDSKREAGEYLKLKARQACGEISDLRLQVPFPLYAPIIGKDGQPLGMVEVARYIADFTYRDPAGALHVSDAKGKRTALYSLKCKWINLQDGVVIEET